MHTPIASAESSAKPVIPTFWLLTLGCIGVVYGDIGTSPLYAFREAVKAAANGQPPGVEQVYGVLSLIIWALVVIVTLKYVLLMLRADNKGEGGILSLMALAQSATGKKFGLVFFMGMIGAALFYGDAAITPAISVLSAVEGLSLITPAFSHLVLPISLVILIALFLVQKHGTQAMSSFFGPIMVVWFFCIGLEGLICIAQAPGIVMTLNPWYGVRFLMAHGGVALAVLGAVFLSVTGAEALYADLGHFGKGPIRTAWLWLVFPCLVLNYMGQGAFVLGNPKGIENPFFLMGPSWSLLPMVGLATVATIIASQAVITGAFSLTRQAVQLGMLPRLEIRHTSAEHEGQIYMPKINTAILLGVLFLTVTFRGSDALAAAYGIAVTGTMIVTSILAYIVVRHGWKRKKSLTLAMVAPFIFVETIFLWANLQKVMEGGYVPLFVAATLILMMGIWVKGTRHLYNQAHRTSTRLSELLKSFGHHPPVEIPGTAVFMTSDPLNAPVALLQNIKHNHMLHKTNILLTVISTHTARASDENRCIIEHISPAFIRIILTFGYAEVPDVPRALQMVSKLHNLPIDFQDISYFLGRRSIVSSHGHDLQNQLARAWQKEAPPQRKGFFRRRRDAYSAGHRGLPEWQDRIYISMANGAVSATDFYRIPRNQAVELGIQLSM
jgi:KUP system potassium uptake protein